MNNYTKKETDRHGRAYYYNDKKEFHRLDGPAIEWADGNKSWYIDGKLHRLDGPAVELSNGGKGWYINGKLHRIDGPAVEHANGSKEWWVNDKLHRLDGSAIEYADGDKYWYVNGEKLTEKEFNKHPLVVEYRLGKIIGEVLSE